MSCAEQAAFGAFARIAEGLEGLIPVSEPSTERVADPWDVVKFGDACACASLGSITSAGACRSRQGRPDADRYRPKTAIAPVFLADPSAVRLYDVNKMRVSRVRVGKGR